MRRSLVLALAALTAALLVAGVVRVAWPRGGGQAPTAAIGSPSAATTPTATATAAGPAKPRTIAPRRTKPRAAASPLYPLPAQPAWPAPCPPPPYQGPPYTPPPLAPVKVPETALPPALPAPKRHVDLNAVSGKGMWLTTWPKSTLDVAAVVARSKAAGVRNLWLRTGGTYQGYYGGKFLRALLPAAHAAGIAVVAWDFPDLSDPLADARRAQRALSFTVAGQRIDAFAPDIETRAERVYLTGKRVALYLSYVRRYAGDRPVVATVPRPTTYRLAHYPYDVETPYVDVFAPMVYWSCKEPGALVQQAFAALAAKRPLNVVGQSYDMGPEGGRQGLPTGQEVWRFLDMTHRLHGVGASLYLYSQTGPRQWAALAAYPWR